MAGWDLHLELDGSDGLPVFLQIARGIAAAISRGALAPGARLPGTRRLAETLGVHRNTAVAAYDELAAQGWIEAARGSGTFVSAEFPDRLPATGARGGVPAQPAFALPRSTAPQLDGGHRGGLALSRGVPDVRLVPTAAIARAYRRAARRAGRFGYGDPAGEPELRAAIADMLNRARGLAASPGDVLITRGSQMAIALAARAVISPGDVVAVEALGYRPAWDALRAAGAALRPIPVDRRGLDVDRLAALCQRRRVRAVYLTPHHQYPTLAVLSPGRRLELLNLARQHRFAVLEDDYDNEYHYSGRPILPLAARDVAGSVVYVGTLSKILAPAIRVGFAVAPAPVLERMIAHRAALDSCGDRLVETAIAELLDEGEIQRHVRRMRRVYLERREILCDALARALGGVVEVECPPGGMALWARVDPAIDVEAWAAATAERGVWFETARSFAFDRRPRQALRLGFASLTPAELRRGVSAMSAGLELLSR